MRLMDDFRNWYQSDAGQKAVNAPGLSQSGVAEIVARWCAEYCERVGLAPMRNTTTEALKERDAALAEAKRLRELPYVDVSAYQRKVAEQAGEILELRERLQKAEQSARHALTGGSNNKKGRR